MITKFNPNNSYCRECKLYSSTKNPCVIGRGNLNSKILILGEALGRDEEEAGLPFVEKSGQYLQHYISALGIDCYISNAVKCRPKTKNNENRQPTPIETECCRAFTMDLILEMKPKVIVVLGKIPMGQLLKLGLAMSVARGKEFYSPDYNAYIIPTYHPSFLLREEGVKGSLIRTQFIRDLQTAKDVSERPPIRKTSSNPVSLKDPVSIQTYLEKLKDSKSFAFDLETTGLDYKEDRITDISFSCEMGKGIHISWLDAMKHEDLLKEVFLSNNEKTGSNLTFDYKFLKFAGFDFSGTFFDTMLAFHTMTMSYEGNEAKDLYTLDTMSFLMSTEGGYKNILEAYGGIVGFQNKKEENKKGKKKSKTSEEQGILFDMKDYEPNTEKDVGLADDPETEERLRYCSQYIKNKRQEILKTHNINEIQYYAAMDSDVTYRVYKQLKPIMDSQYKFPFYEIVMPLCIVLADMTLTGVQLDIPYMQEKAAENKNELVEIEVRFKKKFGSEFDISSSKSLGKLIYEKLGIDPNPRYLTDKGQPSTNEGAITFFCNKRPQLQMILDYRGLQKENSTYLEGFQKQVDTDTGRIHPDFYQLTATGRLSSPFHTIPKDKKIRNMVIPRKGWKLIAADLSQIELRMLAFLAQDENMLNAFSSGFDFHTYTACAMFGIDIKEFDKKIPEHDKRRSQSKCVNPNSLIIINNEIKRIGDIIINKKDDTFDYSQKDLITWEGSKPIKIKGTYRGKKEKSLLIITKRNIICCSENHQIQLKDGSLKKASELREKDILFLEKNIPELKNNKQYVKYNPFKLKNATKKDHKNGFNLELNNEWAYIAGVFTGDGCFAEKHISISVGEGRFYKQWQNEIVRAFNNVGIESKVHEYKKWSENMSSSACVYLGSTYLRRFFDILGLTTEKEGKTFKIPEWVLNNEEHCWQFLGGLIDTDGTLDKNGRTCITTKSWILAQDLTVLFIKLGITYSIEYMYNKPYKRYYFRLHILAKSLPKLAYKNVLRNKFKKDRIDARLLRSKEKSGPQLSENFIVKIVKMGKKDLVDIELEENPNLYWVNGLITHNSINFGIIFGQSEKSLASKLGITVQEASNFMNKFFRSYPKVKPWIERTHEFAIKNKYIETLYGRRRHLPNIDSKDPYVVEAVLRQSVNSTIQSSANDISSMAIIKMDRWLNNTDKQARLVGTVHDSILAEAPPEEVDIVAQQLVDFMTKDVYKITIELKADVDIMNKWGEK